MPGVSEAAPAAGPAQRSLPRGALVLLFLLALVARGGHLARVADSAMMSYHRTFTASDMAIFDEWARRLTDGDWLGREVYHPVVPYQLEIAPAERWREWLGDRPVYLKAPFYAYLLAVCYLVFDDVMVPIAVLQVVASSLAVVWLAVLAARSFGPLAGVFAGLAFALYAPAIHFDAVMLRGPWIALAALFVVATLIRLRAAPSWRRALVLGVAVGAAILVNEGFLTLLPLVLPALPLGGGWRPALGRAAAVLLGTGLGLLPLMARNVAVGVPPLAIAPTGGPAWASFNTASSSPFFFEGNAPGLARLLEESEGRLGPAMVGSLRTFAGPRELVSLYVRRATGLLVPFENPDNANFYYATRLDSALGLLPAYGLVLPLALTGLMLTRRSLAALVPWLPPIASLVAGMMIIVPLSRYRVPMAVLLLPLAGLALARLTTLLRARRWLGVAALTAVALAFAGAAALLERHVFFANTERAALVHRLAEYALEANGHAARRDLPAAAEALLTVVRHNPHLHTRLDALLRLADLALEAGDAAAAGETLGTAEVLAGDRPVALMAVGDFWLHRLGRRDRAAALYRKAVAADRGEDLREPLSRRFAALAVP